MSKVIQLKLIQLIQLILMIVFGLILLSTLWPLFLIFIVVIGFVLLRTFFRLRNAIQSQEPTQQTRDLSQDDDIETPVRSEVIDAEYKERE
jgi:ABC-type bacteriocin/lantibiotic exporter with double-glycine peptidase domain